MSTSTEVLTMPYAEDVTVSGGGVVRIADRCLVALPTDHFRTTLPIAMSVTSLVAWWTARSFIVGRGGSADPTRGGVWIRTPITPTGDHRCSICKLMKPVSAFYFNRHKANGLSSRCGECNTKMVQAQYWANPEHFRAYHKAYKDNPKRREANRRYDAERRQRDRVKLLARFTLNNAVKRGRLARLPCHKCGDQNSQGHHHDYNKPLDVEWLCQRCHAEEHRGEQASPSRRTA